MMFDMVNAGPAIALYVLEKCFGDNCYKFLKRYVADRNRYLNKSRVKYETELGHKSDSEMKKPIVS